MDSNVDKTVRVSAHGSLELIETELYNGEYCIEIEPYASLTYVIKPQISSTQHMVYRIRVDKHASCTLFILLNDINQQIRCEFELYEHAQVDVKGAVLVAGTNKVECVTIQRHKEPYARSSVLIKTILYDASSFDYRGTIGVDKPAQHTSAVQYNKNLMLSSQARATSVPSLEVIADSVSCKHGTATASLKEDHLHYLQSRGIGTEQARRLLIKAFFAEINDAIPDTVRDPSILRRCSGSGRTGLFWKY